MSRAKWLEIGALVSLLVACSGGSTPDDASIDHLGQAALAQSPPPASNFLSPASAKQRAPAASPTVTASALSGLG